MSFLANTSSNYSLYMIPAFWVMNISTHLWAISSFDALPQNKNKKWDNASQSSLLSLSLLAQKTFLVGSGRWR